MTRRNACTGASIGAQRAAAILQPITPYLISPGMKAYLLRHRPPSKYNRPHGQSAELRERVVMAVKVAEASIMAALSLASAAVSPDIFSIRMAMPPAQEIRQSARRHRCHDGFIEILRHHGPVLFMRRCFIPWRPIHRLWHDLMLVAIFACRRAATRRHK